MTPSHQSAPVHAPFTSLAGENMDKRRTRLLANSDTANLFGLLAASRRNTRRRWRPWWDADGGSKQPISLSDSGDHRHGLRLAINDERRTANDLAPLPRRSRLATASRYTPVKKRGKAESTNPNFDDVIAERTLQQFGVARKNFELASSAAIPKAAAEDPPRCSRAHHRPSK